MKRLAIAVLSTLALGGCTSLAESYTDVAVGAGGGYTPPAAGEPSAMVVLYTPANTTGIQGRTVLNLAIGGPPMRVDYYLSRNPIRNTDRPAVPWRGLGDSPEVRVHVQGPVHVAARAQFDGWTCGSGGSFQPAAGRRYTITQVYSGMACGIEVVDLSTNQAVEVTPAAPGH